MRHLIIATRNRHKTGELATLLGASYQVEDLTAHPDMPEIEETGVTFQENATIKALAASRYFGDDFLVLADDSGLEVDALEGAPGVRSARFAGPGANDRQNLALLLDRLGDSTDRAARFRCVITIARGGELLASFDGTCEGKIVAEPKGGEGFGYDPVFVPQGEIQTFAELPAEVKNRLSHRGKSMQLALAWLQGLE